MIPYLEALALLLDEASPTLEVEEVTLEAARDRVVARAVTSPMDQPPFPNSAMDGFAMATGGRELPPGSVWRVAGRLAAGDRPVEGADAAASADRAGDGAGEEAGPPPPAWEIMTGAPVPSGLDTVIPVEQVEAVPGAGGETKEIRVPGPVAPGLNIRPAGKDFREGDPVVSAGRRVGPVELMALAALGIDPVPVLERPRTAVFCTGPELVDDPRAPLEPGRIRNSNGPFLAAALEGMGASVVASRTLEDREGPFLEEVRLAQESGVHLILSTGAVSMGRHDFVPAALERLGARILFHRAAIRPGKPILAAVLPDGTAYLGLPGNPISAAVGLRFFAHPFLLALEGREPEAPWRMPLLNAGRKPAALRAFFKARVEVGPEGTPRVRVLEGQQSFRIRPLLDANAWVVLPEGLDEVPAGAVADVHPLLHPSPWTSALSEAP